MPLSAPAVSVALKHFRFIDTAESRCSSTPTQSKYSPLTSCNQMLQNPGGLSSEAVPDQVDRVILPPR